MIKLTFTLELTLTEDGNIQVDVLNLQTKDNIADYPSKDITTASRLVTDNFYYEKINSTFYGQEEDWYVEYKEKGEQ